MGKIDFKPGTMIYPLPAALVSCGSTVEEYNIITVSWTGTICSDPPMCYVSIRPERYSHEIITRNGEFVINLTNEHLAKAADWCGNKSGRKFNKWKEMNLTPGEAKVVKAPIILESPVSIECKVVEIKKLGSHDMFIANVVNVRVDDSYLGPNYGKFDLESANPLVYSHGGYFRLGKKIGKFGFAVAKKKK